MLHSEFCRDAFTEMLLDTVPGRRALWLFLLTWSSWRVRKPRARTPAPLVGSTAWKASQDEAGGSSLRY